MPAKAQAKAQAKAEGWLCHSFAPIMD